MDRRWNLIVAVSPENIAKGEKDCEPTNLVTCNTVVDLFQSVKLYSRNERSIGY